MANQNTETGRPDSRNAEVDHLCTHGHRRPFLISNARLLRGDPTRTMPIARRFVNDLRKRVNGLRRAVRDFLVTEDELGLKQQRSIFSRLQREFQFRTDAGKLTAFNEFFAQQVQANVFSVAPGTDPTRPWTATYVESAYKRGQINAYLSTKEAQLLEELGVGGQTQAEFLRSSFAAPETVSKVQLLATRTFEDLKGFTSQMGTDLNRILSQGIADGVGPREIARTMTRDMAGLTRRRAEQIARTECLVGSTIVDSASCQKLFRRFYEGDVVEIKTRDGRSLTTTPNHPMLTNFGWVASGQLEKRHKLICQVSENQFNVSRDPNINGRPSSIAEIFDSVTQDILKFPYNL